MFKIDIVDDEQIYIDRIKDVIVNNYDDIEINTYNSVNQINNQVDLLLLDIDMPDVDGIVYSKEHLDTNIIFITNYDTRVKEAFGPNVYGFVSKSNLKEELITAVTNTLKIINNRVTFNVNGKSITINIKDIIYCQYIGGNSVCVIYDNKQLVIKEKSLKSVKEILGDKFIYIDKSTIINTDKIDRIEKSNVYLLGLNTTFTISRRNKDEVLRSYYGV